MQQLRRQQHITAFVAFRRQRQCRVGRAEGRLQVQADVTVAQLVAGQRRRQQHPGIGLRLQLDEEGDERPVQRP